jgi:transposase InsO family protein
MAKAVYTTKIDPTYDDLRPLDLDRVRRRCRDACVRPSMGSVGDAHNNAMCESFFATLECKLLDRCRFKTQTEAIGYLSPIDCERQHHAAAVTPTHMTLRIQEYY